MKIYKKIILGFIVVMTILGMVAFYSPIRNIPEEKNYSASLDNISASSTAPDSVNQTSTSSVSDKASFKDLSGFSDLNKESDLLKEMGTSATSGVDDIFNNLNK